MFQQQDTALVVDTPNRRSQFQMTVISRTLLVLGLVLVTAIGVWSLSPARPTLRDVNRSMRKGDHQQAAAMLDEILADDSGNAEAWQLRAECHYSTGAMDAAADAWKHCIELEPADIKVRIKHATCLLSSARLTDAEAAYRGVLQLDRQNRPARTELQWILFNQMRERELESFLESYLTGDQPDLEALYHLAYSSHRPPNPREAVGKMEAIEKQQPGQPEIEFALARCYWQLGDIMKAESFFRRCIPGRKASLHYSLPFAQFLLEQGRPEESLQILNAKDADLEDWQTDDRWWWLTSQIQRGSGQLKDALYSVEQASARRPGDAGYRLQRAALLNALGQSAAATEQNEEAGRIRSARSECYLIVSRGDLNQLSFAVCERMSQLSRDQNLTLQARYWALAAEVAARKTHVSAGP